MTISIDFLLNGRQRRSEVDPTLTLLEVLREDQWLTGTKEACGVGECGACVVLIDGEPITSCLVLAGDADGKTIETIEGLAVDGLSPIQKAFIDKGALQCGFCTPAMVLTATALLRKDLNPDTDTVKKALGGILCRCGAYPKILDAISEAGAEARGDTT